jgi:hypothetical protein
MSSFGCVPFSVGTFAGGTPVSDPTPVQPTCGTDLLASGLSWLTGQMQAHASQPVVYQRGTSQVGLCATFGRTLLKLDDGFGGVRMEWTDRDFLIPAGELKFGSTPTLPQRGDRIRETKNGATYIFEVMAPGKEPPWRWSDPFRRMLRIHAKQVATEAS